MLVINISDIFSSLITREKSLFLVDKIENVSYNAYCISLCDFDNEQSAQTFCQQLKAEGGMGEVFNRGEFFCLSSIYPTLIEAQEIQENLKILGYDAKVVKLDVPAISKEYKGAGKQIIIECLSSFRQTFLALYDATIDFDKNLTNESQLKGTLAKIWTKTKNQISKVQSQPLSLDEDELSILLQSLLEASTIVEDALLFTGPRHQLSSLLKTCCLDIIQLNAHLAQNF